MDNTFEDDETLLRSVKPIELFMHKDGTLTSAAFKDSDGLSVDRTGDHTLEQAVEFAQHHLTGVIVGVTVLQCKQVEAVVKYLPVPDNNYHSEIHRNEEKLRLNDRQAENLSKRAHILNGAKTNGQPSAESPEPTVISIYWPKKNCSDS